MELVEARKQYRCNGCGRLIEVGEKYWQQHEDQGDAINFKEHTNCALAEKNGAAELPEGFNQNRNLKRC